MGEDAVLASGEMLRLDPGVVSTDVVVFEEALASGELSRAVELYAGPFLDGFHAGGAVEFEHWIDGERDRLARLHAKALETLARQAEDAGDAAEAVEWWRRLAGQDPCDSRIAVRLMQALVSAGNPAGALEHARVHEMLVAERLGAEPSAELLAYAEKLREEHAPERREPADSATSVSSVAEPDKGVGRLIHEIHRRSLWQVLAVYAVASWGVFEVVQTLTEGLRLPDWFPAFAFVLLLIGLPIVLTTAFVQQGFPPPRQHHPTIVPRAEVGVEGRRREPSGARRFFTWRNALTGGVLALALWGLVATAWLIMTPGPERVEFTASRPSVAVLPLENLSGELDAEPFVAGVHDDIITALSQIGALHVTSRTSVRDYRNTDKPGPQIAAELGVATLLQGGVQKIADRIRINVQLIEAETDGHLWAETYDRVLTAENVFAIQSEIAANVARAVGAELTADDRAQLGRVPTRDLEALDYYNRGRDFLYDRREGAEWLLERAVELDPEFADAWARLAYARSWEVWEGGRDTTGVRRALDRAIELAPDAAETALAAGFYFYYVRGEYDRALEHFRRASERRPGDADILFAIALILRRLGDFEAALRHAEQAAELDPRNPSLLSVIADTHSDAAEAERWLDRAIALAPDAGQFKLWKFERLLWVFGDTLAAASFLATHDLADLEGGAATELAVARRDFDEAIEARLSGPILGSRYWRRVTPIAAIYRYAGHEALSQVYADSLRVAAEREVAESDLGRYRSRSLRAWAWLALGYAHAILGDTARALAEAEQATEILPVSYDAVSGPEIAEAAVDIRVLAGDRETALRELEYLQSLPRYSVPNAKLRLHPKFDPLRDDPRFQALLRRRKPPDR